MREPRTTRCLHVVFAALLAGLPPALVAAAGTTTWNTFLGSPALDVGRGVAMDEAGAIYVTGYSASSWGTPLRPHSGGLDIFVAKLDPEGHLLWNTFLGGPDDDMGLAVTLRAGGGVVVAGRSDSNWGSPVSPHTGGVNADILVAALDGQGHLLWHTFLGSGVTDQATGVAAAADGTVTFRGHSGASWGAPVHPYAGGYDMVVGRLDPSGSLLWHTFLGSAGDDRGYGVALHGSDVVILGESDGSWGTPIRPHSGGYDMVVARLDGSGSLVWNTFLGSAGDDFGLGGVTVTPDGLLWGVGHSDAEWGTPAEPHHGGYDLAVFRLEASGLLAWNTFLGSPSDDLSWAGIRADRAGGVLVAGHSDATWGSPVSPYSGGRDMVVAALAPDGSLRWNTFLGSAADDMAYGLAVGPAGTLVVAGYGSATWGDPVGPPAGGGDAAVARLLDTAAASAGIPMLSPAAVSLLAILLASAGFVTLWLRRS